MNDDSEFDNRRNRRNGNRDRGGRHRGADVLDSYRPSSGRYGRSASVNGHKSLTSISSRESRYGRLRGRSASPGSADEGDGRLGFAEDGTSMRRRYRSRSCSRNNRRRLEPSGERWTHDRAAFTDQGHGPSDGRWVKDSSAVRYSDAFSTNRNHRRSDATDETANSRKGSLLARMTKDGKPVVAPRSLASRITRDDDNDEDSTYGRLKNDYSDPRSTEFSESAPKLGLASRITRDDKEVHVRGRSEQSEGINIRGAASQHGGFFIRGVAGGA